MGINNAKIGLIQNPGLSVITDFIVSEVSAVDIGVICNVALSSLCENLVAFIFALGQSG